jgi:hypothetical protein
MSYSDSTDHSGSIMRTGNFHSDTLNRLVSSSDSSGGCAGQAACWTDDFFIGESAMATEGDEVEAPASLVANKPLRHANILHPMSQNRDMGHPFPLRLADPGHPPYSSAGWSPPEPDSASPTKVILNEPKHVE